MIKNREKNQVFQWSKIGYFPFTIINHPIKKTLINYTRNTHLIYRLSYIFSLKTDFFIKNVNYHVNEISLFCITPIKSMDEQPIPLFIILKIRFFSFFAWFIFGFGFLIITTITFIFTTIKILHY